MPINCSSLNPKLTDWRCKRVWLVGASSGIGAALAKQLHELGAHLALSTRRETQLRHLAGDGDRVMPLDVNDADSIREACDTLTKEWGEIDLLVYSAGVYRPMRVCEINQPVIREMLQTNLHGVYNLLDRLRFYLLSKAA